MASPIQSVLILGYGVMGRGVAKGFAAAGVRTQVLSRRAGALADLPAGVEVLGELPAHCPDLILELVPEEMAVKRAAFAAVEKAYPDADFLLATGTSGLDLIEMAQPLARPERLIAIHYYMPADTMPLVEVMAGPASPRASVERAAELIERVGKRPLRIFEPVVGFVVNRLQHAILHEAYWMIQNGICSAADVDFASTHMLGPRMCSTGLVLQKDLSGLKVNQDAQRAIVPHLYHNNQPSRLVPDMVAAGETGIAAGKGFYDWTGRDASQLRAAAGASLGRLLAFLEANTYRDYETLRAPVRDQAKRPASPDAQRGARGG